ncbi:ABC-type transport auxiliary lipoprotein family protein [Candidatus Binatia bacterium]|nr:ABC-type transport auxiliary lipoprotein family protein [Candidatus Binatia bacterium]
MRALRGLVAATLLIGAGAGCISLTQPAPEVRAYRLDYQPPVISDLSPLPVTLRIAPLSANALYDRLAIVYRDDPYSTGTYLSDRWGASPGQMLGDLLARDFAASGLYRAVQQGPAAVSGDYQLGGQIEEIEEREVAGTCSANARLRFLLLRTATGSTSPVLMQSTYEEREPCDCADVRAFVAAMSAGMARISARLQQDVYAAIARDR